LAGSVVQIEGRVLNTYLTNENLQVSRRFGLHPRAWQLVGLIIVMVAWYSVGVQAVTVSTHAFGRYEILFQAGTPVAVGEIIGLVRRQSGLPEYPLVLAWRRGVLELSILGPGNRPIRLASTPFKRPTGARAPTARFIVEAAVRHDDTLTMQLHQASSPAQVSLAVNLRQLERMVEGER
jgi:hypothetical protein